ncbi:MAG: enoyl-CoA hydratase/isomerase family protein [Longimicrobiales bacterium]
MDGGTRRVTWETLIVDLNDGIATITINRPDKRNALNATVRREAVDALDVLRSDGATRVVILTGAGDRAFIAGADISEFAERTAMEQRAAMSGRRLFDEIAAFPKPTIAMINGFALGGGCEVALACDLRIATRSAKLGQPEIRLGLLPGGGGTQRLPRLIGPGRAARLILTGELIDAAEAERIGLVDWVADDGTLLDRTMTIARTIAGFSPIALELAKTAIRAAMEAPLSAGLAHERDLFVAAFASEDRVEGVRAFLEKREPRFTGR